MFNPLSLVGLKIYRGEKFELNISQIELIAGEITCITGSNGSGKTTILESVVGLINPAEGKVLISGQIPTKSGSSVKCDFGYIPDDDGWIIYELTAREYFELLADLYGKAGVSHNLHRSVSILAKELLFESFNIRLCNLSHGNRKKVQIIAGLMHKPKLVIIDELRNGLDPVVIKRAEQLIKRLSESGVSVLAATHDLWWAERFADKVIMINDGIISLQESTENIISESGSLEAKFMELYA